MADKGIYSRAFVRDLFDGMAATYGVINLTTSFGFSRRWRQQCVSLASLGEGMVVCDLMSGMGECWPAISGVVGNAGQIIGLDFSPAMCVEARKTARRLNGTAVNLLEEDVLGNSIADGGADSVVSAFGLKTLSEADRARLAAEVSRILKPGGTFSLLEISVPPSPVLRALFMFYLKRCIPLIGRLFMGNPNHYRHLGAYTEAFGDSHSMVDHLGQHDLEVDFLRLFFGCATVVHGRRAA